MLRMFGLIVMAASVAMGAMFFYMRHIVVSNPIREVGQFGDVTLTTDRASAAVFTFQVAVSVALFCAGLIAFAVGTVRQRNRSTEQQRRPKRRPKAAGQG